MSSDHAACRPSGDGARRAAACYLVGLTCGPLALLGGCGERAPSVERQPSIIRLVDLLPEAAIDSPLAAVRRSVRAHLGAAPVQTIWTWPRSGPLDMDSGMHQTGCVTAATDSASLRCAGTFEVRAEVAITGPALYRALLAATAQPDSCATLALTDQVESFETVPIRSLPATVIVAASQESRKLDLTVRPNAPDCSVLLRSIQLEKVRPGPESALQHAAAFAPLARGDTTFRIAQAGYLLPTGSARDAKPPRDDNFTYREGLLAPTPSTLRFTLRVPDAAHLELGYGFHRYSQVGDQATFEVLIRAQPEQRTETVLREDLSLDVASWHWHEVTRDLRAWAGLRVDLTLRTTARPGSPVLTVWGSPRIVAKRTEGEPPNVVLVAVDTLRADRLSPYDPTAPATPTVEALASEGVVFEQAIAHANWTLPSFASLFTGTTPQRHGVLWHWSALPHDLDTLAEILRNEGWLTHAVLYKPTLARGRNLEQGFETYFNVPLTLTRAELTLAKAGRWVDEHHDSRFFLLVHFDDPHQPFAQPADFVDEKARTLLAEYGLSLPVHIEDALKGCAQCRSGREPRTSFVELARRLYDDEVRYLDGALANLFATLRHHGLWENTLVLLVSDHGETLWRSWGELNRYGHRGPSLQDHLLRVPLIIKPSATMVVARGTRVSRQVQLVDVLPTVLDLLGIEASRRSMDGQSLVPLMAPDQRGDTYEERPAFSVGPVSEGVRVPDWKYIRARSSNGVREYLFDLDRDPGETANLAKEGLPALALLRATLATHAVEQRPGASFLLVRDRKSEGPVRVEVRGVPSCPTGEFAEYGLRFASCGDGLLVYEGNSARGLVLLAELPSPRIEDLVVTVRLRTEVRVFRDIRSLAYRRGSLGELVEQEDGSPVLLEVPGRLRQQEIMTSGDLQELQALRALGYVD